MVFQGVIRHFEYSAIARRIRAGPYLYTSSYKQKLMQKSAEDQCTYCRAPLVQLSPALFKKPICDTVSLPHNGSLNYQQAKGKGVTVSAYCCLEGHLTGVYQGWDGGKLLNREVLPESGADLSVETCRVERVLSSGSAPNPGNCAFDLTVKKSLDAFSAARKIKALADKIEKDEGEDKVTGVEEWWPEGEITQNEYEIRCRQTIANYEQDWIDDLYRADLFKVPAQELESIMVGDSPFWSIDEGALARIKNLLDSIPKSEGVFLEYLNHREHTPSITLERIRRLQFHNLKAQELEDARKMLIATAF